MCKVLANISPVLKDYHVIKSLTFFRLPERYQVTLVELHVLMQKFPRVITDMNALNQKYLCSKQLHVMNSHLF